jgi:hypothetical protein
VLEEMLRASTGLTIREAHARRPTGADWPQLQTVARWLRALADAGRRARTGRGHHYAPFRYRLVDVGQATAGPGKEAGCLPTV